MRPAVKAGQVVAECRGGAEVQVDGEPAIARFWSRSMSGGRMGSGRESRIRRYRRIVAPPMGTRNITGGGGDEIGYRGVGMVG